MTTVGKEFYWKKVEQVIDEKLMIEDFKQTFTDEFLNEKAYGFGKYSLLELIEEIVERQPQADKWIPCSERLPKSNGMYLITQERYSVNEPKNKLSPEVTYCDFNNGAWRRANFFKVLAWQPLPQPYKKEGVE